MHLFPRQMPTGVAVTDDGRIFVAYARWDDDVEYTVGEIRDGQERPYPDADRNTIAADRLDECLVSVHRVRLDGLGRLWLLDTGSILCGPPLPGAAKLVCVDLEGDEVVRTIPLPRDVALKTSYLNDVRFDLRRGEDGMAFISDSGQDGPNGFVVVDLASGRSWRKLTGHPTTRGVPGYVAMIEGQPLSLSMKLGVDGIAISHDGLRLYYCALTSRRLYSVSLFALADEEIGDEEAASTITDLGEKGAADGLEADAEGRVYASNYEEGSVLRADPDGAWETLVHQPGMLFVDSLCLAGDGYLYFTVNQLHRHPEFQDGVDRRQRPFALLRTPVDGTPIRLLP